jgi:zinc protease
MRVDRSRLPDVGPDPPFVFPEIVRHTLGNGLAVRTVEHHSLPIVTFVLQVDGGSAADPGGLEGLAAVTADMVDEGTGSLSAIDVSDALARIGAEYDVDVGPDATVFTLTTLARFAARGASLLAALVTRPSLREHDFERVRQLRLDRLRQLKDLPPAVAERSFLHLLYGEHPYGHLAIGNERALRRLTRDLVAEFHASTYQPQRATLVAAGALRHAELRRLIEDAFDAWPSHGTGTQLPALPEPPVGGGARLVIVPRERAPQSELRIGHLVAGRKTPDYLTLLVMNAVLGGQFVSRVNLTLREQKGYTYGARTSFDWRRGPTPFTLQASVQTEVTAEAVRDALNELSAIRGSRPPDAHELALAKASLTRGYPRHFETCQQVARAVAQLALYDLPDTYYDEFVPAVAAVTGDEVVAAARRHLDPDRLTTLVVGDRSAVEPALATLGLGSARVLLQET